MSNKRRTVLLVSFVIAALIATALLASSCGTSGTSTQGGSTQMTGQAEIDNFLQQLDNEMSSVPTDAELNDTQLSDSQLGI